MLEVGDLVTIKSIEEIKQIRGITENYDGSFQLENGLNITIYMLEFVKKTFKIKKILDSPFFSYGKAYVLNKIDNYFWDELLLKTKIIIKPDYYYDI